MAQVFGREGKVWRLENHDGEDQASFEIEDTNPKQCVHMRKCANISVLVKGKVGEIIVDQCKNVVLSFESALGSCAVINTTKSKVHVLGSTPCVQVDRSNGIEVYLSKECESSAELLTSCSMEVSVHAPPAEANGHPIELHIPQQYTSKIVRGRLVTTPVQHGRH